MIETVLITGFVVSAAAASGIPQTLYKKHKSKFKDFGLWASEKWFKLRKTMGVSNPKKLLTHEKAKIDRSIEKLIEVVANYEAMLFDIDYQIKKYESTPEFSDTVDDLKQTRESISQKLEIAKCHLKDRKECRKELVQFINEAYTDETLFRLDPSSKDEQKFLKHQADVENIKRKKDV
jgi:hypothetical protein